MFGFFRKDTRKAIFDRKVLRKNNISLLILDERWNNLFSNAEKTPQITKCEAKIKELLKDEARLTAESRDISTLKKKLMDRIIKLTPEAYEKNNEQAKNEMKLCEQEIKRINERSGHIQDELERVPELIRETNLELLEYTVNQVYLKIRVSQKRVEELERLIEETREKLKGYVEEKETLSQGGTDIYSYFHDLLGAEELERLDKEFFD